MAFDTRALSVLAYANGFTAWHYTTTDPLHPHPDAPEGEAVLSTGYFDRAADMLKAGHMIMVNADTARSDVTTGAMLLVTSAGKQGVTVAVMAQAAAPTAVQGD